MTIPLGEKTFLKCFVSYREKEEISSNKRNHIVLKNDNGKGLQLYTGTLKSSHN